MSRCPFYYILYSLSGWGVITGSSRSNTQLKLDRDCSEVSDNLTIYEGHFKVGKYCFCIGTKFTKNDKKYFGSENYVTELIYCRILIIVQKLVNPLNLFDCAFVIVFCG